MNRAIFNGSIFTTPGGCLGDGELHLVQRPPAAPAIGRFPLVYVFPWDLDGDNHGESWGENYEV